AQAPYLDPEGDMQLQWSLGERETVPIHYSVVKAPSYNYSVTVPGGAKVFAKVMVTEYDLHIGYVGTAMVTTDNGGLWMFTSNGLYSGKAFELGEENEAVI
ncbi:unnamed protein product, partial [Ostreobium quekettii]